MADLPGIELAGGEIIPVRHREAYSFSKRYRIIGAGFGSITEGTAKISLIAIAPIMTLRQIQPISRALGTRWGEPVDPEIARRLVEMTKKRAEELQEQLEAISFPSLNSTITPISEILKNPPKPREYLLQEVLPAGIVGGGSGHRRHRQGSSQYHVRTLPGHRQRDRSPKTVQGVQGALPGR